MFKIDKRKMIVPGGMVKYQNTRYDVVSVSSNNIVINNGKDNHNASKSRVEVLINEKTLKALIGELNKRVEIINTKIRQLERLGKDEVDKYSVSSSEILEISESNISESEKLIKINDIIKNIKHFENGDRVKIISNKKQKLKISSEWKIVRASNPLVLVNKSGQQQNVYKSEVETIGENKSELTKEKEFIDTELDVYKKIHDYLSDEDVDEFDDGQYLSWYIVNIMNSDKKDYEKTREIARILNSSLNKIDVDVLKQH